MAKNSCDCDCHKPGVVVMHAFPCCTPNEYEEMDLDERVKAAHAYFDKYKQAPPGLMTGLPNTQKVALWCKLTAGDAENDGTMAFAVAVHKVYVDQILSCFGVP